MVLLSSSAVSAVEPNLYKTYDLNDYCGQTLQLFAYWPPNCSPSAGTFKFVSYPKQSCTVNVTVNRISRFAIYMNVKHLNLRSTDSISIFEDTLTSDEYGASGIVESTKLIKQLPGGPVLVSHEPTSVAQIRSAFVKKIRLSIRFTSPDSLEADADFGSPLTLDFNILSETSGYFTHYCKALAGYTTKKLYCDNSDCINCPSTYSADIGLNPASSNGLDAACSNSTADISIWREVARGTRPPLPESRVSRPRRSKSRQIRIQIERLRPAHNIDSYYYDMTTDRYPVIHNTDSSTAYSTVAIVAIVFGVLINGCILLKVMFILCLDSVNEGVVMPVSMTCPTHTVEIDFSRSSCEPAQVFLPHTEPFQGFVIVDETEPPSYADSYIYNSYNSHSSTPVSTFDEHQRATETSSSEDSHVEDDENVCEDVSDNHDDGDQ
ncbi:hypothetical protein BV898_11433 [Hypsibius exemplaris]|uniref:Uncharacterized protein n=1 Tax=Hypsibius exemplaris TaxID=2072580 RepID=A0A1W0WGI7_HYPEX|nr:hypothetical protein BV898_11433 [Hypsibius exemplaris]